MLEYTSLNFENTVNAAEFLSILLKYTGHLFKILFCSSVKAFLALTLSDQSRDTDIL